MAFWINQPRQPHLQASASPRLCMNREWRLSANQILNPTPARDVTVSHCATESLGLQGKNDWLGVADLQTPRSVSALKRRVFELHECLEARVTSGKRNDEHAKSAVYLPLAIKLLRTCNETTSYQPQPCIKLSKVTFYCLQFPFQLLSKFPSQNKVTYELAYLRVIEARNRQDNKP